jgi:hypothetical protein
VVGTIRTEDGGHVGLDAVLADERLAAVRTDLDVLDREVDESRARQQWNHERVRERHGPAAGATDHQSVCGWHEDARLDEHDREPAEHEHERSDGSGDGDELILHGLGPSLPDPRRIQLDRLLRRRTS